MKTAMLAVSLVLVAHGAWGGCDDYSYQELLDMRPDRLQQEYSLNRRLHQNYSNGMITWESKGNSRLAAEWGYIVKDCDKKVDRIRRAADKRKIKLKELNELPSRPAVPSSDHTAPQHGED